MKRIHQYLKETSAEGTIFMPTRKMEVNCYVDTYFSGICGFDYPEGPILTNSRTGYIITFSECPMVLA